jgi:hypothetical protein
MFQSYFWRSILIVSSHLRLDIPSDVFPSGFPTKTLFTPLLFPYASMPRPSYSSWFGHSTNMWWEEQIIKLLVVQYSPLPFYLVPFKCPPQHPVLEHPQPMFLPQCEWPSFTTVKSNRKIIVLYILIFIFWDSELEHKKFCTEREQTFLEFGPLLIFVWM